MSAQHTYGWADLDKANGSHYGHGKPADLLDAEQDAELAWTIYDRAVDVYYDQHYGEQSYLDAVNEKRRQAEQAQIIATEIYNKHYGKVAPDAHLEAQHDDKTDF